MALKALVLLGSILITSGQRPSFAGSRPIGFPELINRTTTPSGLEDKFGEGTTQRLPIEAQGDRDLIDRLSKLPIDKQPFWFINWQALEAQRGKPQTYPQRPNPFLESNFQNVNSAPQNPSFNPVNSNPGFMNPNPSFINPNPISPYPNPVFTNLNAGIPNSGTGNPVPANTGNSNVGSGVQSPSWKVQGSDNKNSNVDNRYGTETSTVGTTSTAGLLNAAGSSNTLGSTTTVSAKIPASATNGNTDTFKVTDNNSKPVSNSGPVSSNPDKKDKEGTRAEEENEFEDIQVKKFVK